MYADVVSAAADLEDVGAGSGSRLVIYDLARCGVLHIARAEEERAVVTGRQGIRILHVRRGVHVDKTRGTVVGIVTNEVFAVVEHQVVIAPAVLHGEFIIGQSTVVIGDDTFLVGIDRHVRTVHGAFEQSFILRVDNQVSAAGGDGGGLGVIDGNRLHFDRRDPEYLIPVDGQICRCLLDENSSVGIGHRQLETLCEGCRRNYHPEKGWIILCRAQFHGRFTVERNRLSGSGVHGNRRSDARLGFQGSLAGKRLILVSFDAYG